jgi:hypothetical protein
MLCRPALYIAVGDNGLPSFSPLVASFVNKKRPLRPDDGELVGGRCTSDSKDCSDSDDVSIAENKRGAVEVAPTPPSRGRLSAAPPSADDESFISTTTPPLLPFPHPPNRGGDKGVTADEGSTFIALGFLVVVLSASKLDDRFMMRES